MRARLRRLEREGRLRRSRGAAHRPVVVTLTESGGASVGLPVYPRRPNPARLGHELAILKRVIAIEAHFAAAGGDGRVLTERDLRRAEARGEDRFHVEVIDLRGRRRRRWPDYVVDVPAGRTAVELEFSAKAKVRLRSIVQGYSRAQHYGYVDFVLLERPEDGALRRRLDAMISEEHALDSAARLPGVQAMPRLAIVPWHDPLPKLHAGIGPFPRLPTATASNSVAG